MFLYLQKLKFLPINRMSGTLVLIAIMASIASEMVLMAVIYTMISGPAGESFKFLNELSLETIGLIALIAAVLKVGTSYYAIKKKSIFIFYSQTNLASSLYRNYIWRCYKDIENKSSAELVRTIASEAQNVIKMVLIPIVTIISEILPAISILLFAMYIRPVESAVSFLTIGLVGYSVNRFFKYKISIWGNLRRLVEEKITGMLIDTDRLFKEITIYQRQELFTEKFNTYQDDLAEVGRKQNFASEVPKVILEGLVYAGMALYLLYGLYSFSNPLEVIATIAVLGLTALRVVPSVHRIVSAFNTMRYGLPSLDKIIDELTIQANFGTQGFESNQCSSIEVNDLSYCREEVSNPIFTNISFTVHKGEILGIKGASGSGKSTFLNVLLGLLPATKGKIIVDNKDVSDIGLFNYASVGIVPQQVYIFKGTILENLSLYDVSLSNWRIRARDSLKSAKMLEFVDSFDAQLEKQLSENSKDISGGQAQRFSIARSLYNNPEILLFDEFTSALDSNTQSEILSELKEIAINKIIIIVSHSGNVLSICDKVIDLDKVHVSKD